MKSIISLLLISLSGLLQLQAQSIDTTANPPLILGIDEILSLPRKSGYDQEIVSASKKAESLFEAPIGASVLTREEIRSSGATNVMEALRLLPGVIVRQIANGSYNIHLRGMDWFPHVAEEDVLSGQSKLVLLMIDGRPLYNYLQGNIFWETLPIALHDVEQIELVRGPASSLYGPNAVTGVINIITTRPVNQGAYAVANAQIGSFGTNVLNGALGYKFDNGLSIVASANREYRGRTTELFYDAQSDTYQPLASFGFFGGVLNTQESAEQLYPNPNVAISKGAANLFLDYQPNDEAGLSLKAGIENTESFNVLFPDFETFLTKYTSSTRYVDMDAHYKGAKVKASYLFGTQDPFLGGLHTQKFNFLDFDASYTLQVAKGLSLTPSVSYRLAEYWHPVDESELFSDIPGLLGNLAGNLEPGLSPADAISLAFARTFRPPLGILPGRKQIDNPAFALRADYAGKKLRVVASIRGDQFSNLSTKVYSSYQLATTYKIGDNQLIRVGVSRSNSSQFVIDTQVSLIQPLGALEIAPGVGIPRILVVNGNKNLDPISQTSIELGYRQKVNQRLSLDFEVFHGILNNHRTNVKDSMTINLNTFAFPYAVQWQNMRNLETTAHQTGVTLSLSYVDKKLWLRPFLTVQRTIIKGHSDYNATAEFAASFPTLIGGHIGITEDITNPATPAFFGGLYFNYRLMSKLNLNVTSYFLGNQEFVRDHHALARSYQTGARIITNLRLGYDISRQATFFVAVRDLSSSDKAEYFYTDPVKASFFLGLNYQVR